MIRRYITLGALFLAPFIRDGSTDSLEVTPSSGTVDAPPYAQAYPVNFSVTNTGSRTVDVAISAPGCQPHEQSCAWSTFSLDDVLPNESRSLTITVTTGAPGSSGTVGFIALVNDNQTVQAGTTVTVRVPQQAWLETKALNPGTTIERSHCVAFPVATNAAYECGDLRIAHAAPSLRVRNDDRTPVLLYNSAHAEPRPVVLADISTPNATSVTNVTATLTVRRGASDVQVASQSFGTLAAASTQRIALTYDASGDTTGIYPYTMAVSITVDGQPQPPISTSDTLVIVNRKTSPFGAGWWLAGYERLVPLAGGSFLWVGGDGSTRRYAPDSANPGVFRTLGLYRPDSLTLQGSTYVRMLRHRAQVQFDLSGRHVATVDPLNSPTTFQHDGSGRLQLIIHPTASQPRHALYYSAGGLLDSLTGPGPISGTRRITLLHGSGGRVERITDADGIPVNFGFDTLTGLVITSRTNRNGVTQTFGFASNRLVQATVPLTATESAVTTFCPAEIRGLASGGCGSAPLPPADATTTVDGPRTDVTDVTTIKTDRFGGPEIVTDPLGQRIRLYRGNRGLPGLVTRTVGKNGKNDDWFYFNNGTLGLHVDYSPLGPGRDAQTHFDWGPKWERITQITYPEGNVVSFAYDDSTGNRIWQQSGTDPAHRVTFAYYTSGAGAGLLRSVTYPVVQSGRTDKDSIEYDALGNPSIVRSLENTTPLAVARYTNDNAGRQTSACSDIVVGGAKQCTNTAFDIMDRDSVVRSIGDAVNFAPAQTLTVSTTFDAEGNAKVIVRTPSDGTIQPLRTRRAYDFANRLVADTAPDGFAERRTYDLGGNVVRLITRRLDTLTMSYDALNRLTSRTLPGRLFPKETVGLAAIKPNVPAVNPPYPRKPNDPNGYRILAETHTFEYNELGQITAARNADAHVRRTYFPNGLLATETDSVRTVAGGDLSQHLYGMSYAYDLNGRLHALRYPAQLVQSPNNSRDSVVYAYDGQTGEVSQVSDLLGNTFGYVYDNAGQLARLDMPGSVRESFGYDGAGRVKGDTIRDAANVLLRATGFVYQDARGKVTSSINSVLKRDSLSALYSGLGFVIRSTYRDVGTDFRGNTQTFSSKDSVTYDALGNMMTSVTTTTNSTAAIEDSYTSAGRTYVYNTTSGRLRRIAGNPRPDSLVYDSTGNVRFQFTQTPPTNVPVREDRMSYFAADGTLRATDHRTRENGSNAFTFTFEEYWYDALGRRVLTRTRQECDPQDYDLDACTISTVRRTLWDGAKELFEIQMPDSTTLGENDTALIGNLGVTKSASPIALNPFYGRVAYTNGPGFDQPLSVTRWGYADTAFVGTATERQFEQWKEPFTIVPHWNQRGQADYGTTATGSGGAPCGGGTPPGGGASSGRCALVYWPYGWTAYWQKTYREPSWNGTLVNQKRDGSHLVYKRNRYYDPATARFTQEDPIGLAGGLNLYGFAGGDPVNFSDPFGLQACYLWSDKNSPDCIAAHRNVESCMSGGPCEYTIGIVPDISPGGRGLIKWARDLGVAGRRGATLVRQAANLRGYLMHLTASDLRGAARELRGLQSGGQHLQEVREAVGGLRGFIDDLNQALSNPNLSELERTGFGSLLGVASRALDRAEAALR